MSRQLPFLAMDGVLCDYSLPLFGGKATTKKELQKMKTMSTSDAATYARLFVKNRAVANRYWRACMGQDSALDNETAEKLKGFLKSRLSAEDHEQVCNMLAGDVEAQDTEPPPQFRRMPDGTVVEPQTAEDSKSDFFRRFPDAARIRIDNSGIQPPARASHSGADTEDFYRRYPDARRIKVL
jgi:hypothetical protein